MLNINMTYQKVTQLYYIILQENDSWSWFEPTTDNDRLNITLLRDFFKCFNDTILTFSQIYIINSLAK